MNIKKIIIGLLLTISIISSVACSPRSKAMKEIEGKDGLFAIITTSKGEVAVKLYYKETPLTVINFVGLAEGILDATKGKKFYDGLKFHRVISLANGDGQDFMIQGGCPLGNGTGDPGYKFPDEFRDNLIFDRPGLLAMANSGPGTNGSQFFITIVPTPWLNGKHTIFGEVVFGQDIVKTTRTNDVIKSIKIVRNGDDANSFTATQSDFDRCLDEALKFEKEAAAKAAEEAKKALEQLIDGCKQSKSGVYYKIVKEGKGNKIGEGKHVTCEYRGYLPDGRVFDASQAFHPQGHEAIDFVAGAGDMIPGFDEMVQDMKVDETRTMIIPPQLAYGANGIPGVIPGNSYICFDVTVVRAE